MRGWTFTLLLLSAGALACPADDHRCHAVEEIDEAERRLATVNFLIDVTEFTCSEPDEYAKTRETAEESCQRAQTNIAFVRKAIVKVRDKLAIGREKILLGDSDLCEIRRIFDQPRADSRPLSVRGWIYEMSYKEALSDRRGVEPQWVANLISSKGQAAWRHINNAHWHVVDAIFMEGWKCL